MFLLLTCSLSYHKVVCVCVCACVIVVMIVCNQGPYITHLLLTIISHQVEPPPSLSLSLSLSLLAGNHYWVQPTTGA